MNRREALLGALAVGAASYSLPGNARAAEAAPLKAPATGPVLVAFVIGNGANVMDLAGPWESLQDVVVSGREAFRMATVSDTTDIRTATGGLKITPDFSFDTLPAQPNVIIMGAQGEHTPKKIAWIREAAPKADIVMSVCTGAFLLAKTGLLDGLNATTHHEFYDKFEKQFPKVHLQRGPRYVENGKLVTAGGLTSGIELALRVVQRYFGDDAAARTAYYMEYNRSSRRPVA